LTVITEMLTVVVLVLEKLWNQPVVSSASCQALQIAYSSLLRQELPESQRLREIADRWSAPLTKVFEFLLTYQKENFLLGNCELRVKSRIFDQNQGAFKESFSVEELHAKLDKDLFENGRVLSTVLTTLFEGYEEDPNEDIRDRKQEKLMRKRKELKRRLTHQKKK